MNASDRLRLEQATGVYVSLSGEDTVGHGLAYAIREELRRSAAFDVAPPNRAGLQILVVSVDDAAPGGPTGLSSSIALVYTMTNFADYDPKEPQTWYPIFLTAEAVSLGRKQIETQARSAVATLNNEVERYRANLQH